MLNGDEIETGNSGKVGTEAGVLPGAEIEQTADAGLAQIGVYEQGAIAKLSEGDGKIRCGSGFAFARQRAGHENDLGRTVSLREKQSGAQGAEGFGHLRLGEMLSYELNAFVVTVAGVAFKQADTRAIAVGFGKRGNNRKGR